MQFTKSDKQINSKKCNSMVSIDKFTLLEWIRKVGLKGDVDFLQEGLKVTSEALMDAEVSQAHWC
ncbi:hypothetical protein [Caenibacillus caldisaponilyticus]|uniref:hypothetical protein n=1 Tax=Caenibacillus caldisaponilyticus TaxID=1674942 RepID=UPI000988314F|nr:hypothetical protein [Caenibacillus caldisaponilyticus]